MPTINNYTTQTNSHEGYTIEELKRLFEKPITVENLKKLISHSFNYELVSGKGIRILELKNNDFKNNTTKTYKIECTCEGGGGGQVNIKADQGAEFDPENPDTVRTALYDYTENGSILEEGIYPVSLSEDGKLIVDMSESTLNIIASSATAYHAFENTDLEDNFNFYITIKGNRINVTKIEVWIDEGGQEMSKEVYNDESSEVARLNNNKSLRLYKDCSAKLNENDPDSSIKRIGKIKVTYTLKGQVFTKIATADTTFIHAIYYGYTCNYRSSDPIYVHPERIAENPTNLTQPCFKVYSNNSADYDENNKRTGLSLTKTSGNYDLTMKNTETDTTYTLGYFVDGVSVESNINQHTNRDIPNGKSFSLTKLGKNDGEAVFMVFLVPKHMTKFTAVDCSIDNGLSFSILDTLLAEKVNISDYAYYDNGERIVNLEYTAYTMKNMYSTDVENNIKIDCVVSTI